MLPGGSPARITTGGTRGSRASCSSPASGSAHPRPAGSSGHCASRPRRNGTPTRCGGGSCRSTCHDSSFLLKKWTLGNHRADHHHRSTAPPQPGPGYWYPSPEGARRMAVYPVAYPGSPQQGPSEEPPHHQPRRLSPATEVPGPGRSREPRARRPRAPPERSDLRSTTVRSIWLPGPPTGWPTVTRRPGHGRCPGSAGHAGPRPRRPAADPLPPA